MPRRLQVFQHLTESELLTKIASLPEGIERTRFEAVLHSQRGEKRAQVAARLGRQIRWLSGVIRRYNAEGPSSLRDKRHENRGAERRLSAEQMARLAEALQGPPPAGTFWSNSKVTRWVQSELGLEICNDTAVQYMHRLGYRRCPLKDLPAAPCEEKEPKKRPFEGAQKRNQSSTTFADRPYPSDLTDAQWQLLQPLLPKVPDSTPLREIVNAMLYILRTGAPWAYLPRDFPPKGTVAEYFYAWSRSGLWKQIVDALRPRARQQAGRNEQPTVGLLDSQTVKTAEKGGSVATMEARK